MGGVGVVPVFIQDSDRVKCIKAGLNTYFAAVSLRGVSRESKLEAIRNTFSADAELITSTNAYSNVLDFYASENSPVMKDPEFCPTPKLDTLCVSSDSNTIAVEISLNDSIKVGDWFTFDEEGKISCLRIYS